MGGNSLSSSSIEFELSFVGVLAVWLVTMLAGGTFCTSCCLELMLVACFLCCISLGAGVCLG